LATVVITPSKFFTKNVIVFIIDPYMKRGRKPTATGLLDNGATLIANVI
jgi:hypothetical protein